MTQAKEENHVTTPILPSTSFPVGEVIDKWWCAVHTLPRSEKAFAQYLLDRNLPYFLPLVPAATPGHTRPLFDGIIFLAATKKPLKREVFTRHAPPTSPTEINKYVHQSRFREVLDEARRSRYFLTALHSTNQPRLRLELAAIALPSPLQRPSISYLDSPQDNGYKCDAHIPSPILSELSALSSLPLQTATIVASK